MIKYYTNRFDVLNIYKSPSNKSEIVSQMIYGESFSISKRAKEWIKIKTKDDSYSGYIKNKKLSNYLKPTHKVCVLKAKIYDSSKKSKKINELSFNSKLKITNSENGLLKFTDGWIIKDQVKSISFKEKNPFGRIRIFKDIKYKWGGKSFKGIDCSALVQICLNFNNKYCPRDTKDQVKFFRKNIDLNKIKRNNIIFWKGHVAVALSKEKLIHAYGPSKKTVIMNLQYAINRIEKTAKLKITQIKKI